MIAELTAVPLLIIDDLGMRSYQRLPPRISSNSSCAVASEHQPSLPQIDRSKIGPSYLATRRRVTAFLDRLMHHGHLLEIPGKSYRLHESRVSRANRKAPTLP